MTPQMPPLRIPVVDFSSWRAGDAAARDAFADALGRGLGRYGFVSLVGHPIEQTLLDEAFAAAAEVFALPEPTKARYEAPAIARQRGYTPYLREKAKDRAAPDLKSFWHVGRDVEGEGLIPANVFPAEVPAFERATRALYAAQEALALELLAALERYLDQPAGRFVELARGGNSVLRVIDYPDLDGPAPAGAVRAAAHEDINLLTILPAATRPGLEILTPDERWVAVTPPPGALVVDTGDMMALLTGGRMPATTHRVVNPEGADGGRVSMPFFLHPHPDATLQPMDGDAPGVRAHDFLMERLVANGVA